MIRPGLMILPLLLLTAAAPPRPPRPPQGSGGTLTIEVNNVRIAKGKVHVDICPEAQFLKDDCPWSGDAIAQQGMTPVTVAGLPPGRYAAQAFLDENSNGKVDRAFGLIPKEGIGFSNDAKITTHAPSFADTAFTYDGSAQTIRLSLRYFSGPKGPDGS